MLNKSTKIEVSVGCTEFLISEVESLRRQNEILRAEKNVMDNFFSLVNRLEGKPSQGYGSDLLWDAKKEIREATAAKSQTQSVVSDGT